MRQQESKQITLSKAGLLAGLALALVSGGGIVYLLTTKPLPPETTHQATIIQAPKPVNKPPTPTSRPVEKQVSAKPPVPEQNKPVKQTDEFTIQGLLSTGGEPWAANMIVVKILWLKNKGGQQFLPGQEGSLAQVTPMGFAYRLKLKPQPNKYLNWNSGVEGNVGRLVAFVDLKRDGRLTPKQDRIIAVSKELIRYRTGRFDKSVLNTIQQENIRRAGKGYVLVRNMQIDEDKPDWHVIATKSPVRLDLNATETSLAGMYNTFMKLQ